MLVPGGWTSTPLPSPWPARMLTATGSGNRLAPSTLGLWEGRGSAVGENFKTQKEYKKRHGLPEAQRPSMFNYAACPYVQLTGLKEL